MYLPLLGRVDFTDWPVIIISLLLAWIEFFISVITHLLPQILIDFFTGTISVFFKYFKTNPIQYIKKSNEDSYSKSNEISDEDHKRMINLLNAKTVQEMCHVHGYEVENRIVRTSDGYLLTIHRLVSNHPRAMHPNGKVVYFHHGLLMSSEIWVTMIDKYSNLPYILYDLGYDVWLGNNRGNKYSQKHLTKKLQGEAFWDFSLDEFALFDIPSTIDYILNETGNEKLTYIGFSQGTAQAFASLSINPQLNNKIVQFIAISPATTPHGLYSTFLDILLKSSPSIIYLLFSRKVLLPSTVFWQKTIYPPLFNVVIDLANYMLFNWKSANISEHQKISSYAHLYSTTSVKSVVHWFQVISAKNFQMYHDTNSTLGLNPISYPLKNIQVPIHLIYGTVDSLVDIDVMKNQLPNHTTTQPVENHEHLDNIWGSDVYDGVFRHVLDYMGEDNVHSRLLKNNEQKLIEDIVSRDDDDVETMTSQPLNYLKVAGAKELFEGKPFTPEIQAKPHRSLSTGRSIFD